MSSWLDGLIGWDKDFNTIETCIPDDPAIGKDSDIDGFLSNNFDMSYLKVKDGQTPAKMTVTLPTPAQWASVVPHFRALETGDSTHAEIAFLKLFELCVRFPDADTAQPEFREGFQRLPAAFMRGLVTSKRQYLMDYVGGWLATKYSLSESEKKAS